MYNEITGTKTQARHRSELEAYTSIRMYGTPNSEYACATFRRCPSQNRDRLRNVDVYMHTYMHVRWSTTYSRCPAQNLVCYVGARVVSSKGGRWSVPRLETMTSQEVFRQVPEHTNPIRRTFAIQGGWLLSKVLSCKQAPSTLNVHIFMATFL